MVGPIHNVPCCDSHGPAAQREAVGKFATPARFGDKKRLRVVVARKSRNVGASLAAVALDHTRPALALVRQRCCFPHQLSFLAPALVTLFVFWDTIEIFVENW